MWSMVGTGYYYLAKSLCLFCLLINYEEVKRWHQYSILCCCPGCLEEEAEMHLKLIEGQ